MTGVSTSPAATGLSLLSDEHYVSYLIDGYLTLQPASLTAADHEFLYRRAADLYRVARATQSPTAHLDYLGDNLRAQIPELDDLLNDPVVDGALTSILGPDYVTHPHSYCHRSTDRDQVFHQDGNLPWNERGHYRSHRPEWAMLFYYPQEVDAGNGPTEVVPGSQYWTIDHETDDGRWHPGDRLDRTVDDAIMSGDDIDRRDRCQEEALERGLAIPGLERRFLDVGAGTVVIAHYDLVHRGSRTVGTPAPRFLYKFYFTRVHQPGGPSWKTAGHRPDLGTVRPTLRPVVDTTWQWSLGRPVREATTAADPVALATKLLEGREDEKVEAAYRLGRAAGAPTADGRAVELLEAGLVSGVESTRRAAGHGLRLAGARGVDPLLRGLESTSAPVRRPSVAGLGSLAAARSSAAVAAVLGVLDGDPDDLVRAFAAHALGQISRAGDVEIRPIVEGLLARLHPGAEPDNAFGAELSRSTVRQSAAYGLVQAMANHTLDDDLIDRIVDGPLTDRDRYIQGLLVEGLARTGHVPPAARRRLVRFLAGRRWSPSAS